MCQLNLTALWYCPAASQLQQIWALRIRYTNLFFPDAGATIHEQEVVHWVSIETFGDIQNNYTVLEPDNGSGVFSA